MIMMSLFAIFNSKKAFKYGSYIISIFIFWVFKHTIWSHDRKRSQIRTIIIYSLNIFT